MLKLCGALSSAPTIETYREGYSGTAGFSFYALSGANANSVDTNSHCPDPRSADVPV